MMFTASQSALVKYTRRVAGGDSARRKGVREETLGGENLSSFRARSNLGVLLYTWKMLCIFICPR